MKHRAEIETFVERFLEGRTTSSEERELYAWFASADIPEEWHDLKAMFAWYSEGMPETVIEADTADTAQCSPQRQNTTTPQPTPQQHASTSPRPTPQVHCSTSPQPTPQGHGSTSPRPTPQQHASTTLRRRWIWLTSGAVGTGIAATVATLLWFTPARPTFDIYEGSYIIEAGVRCDNSDYIRADIEALLERADNIEQKADMLLALAD